MLKIGILDDYARIALNSADWSRLPAGTEITVFDRHLTEEEAATELLPFEVLCTVRERMALPRSLLQRLPRLKLLTIVGMSLPNLDMAAATALGIVVSHSDFQRAAFAKAANATPELAWGLMIATVRHIAHEDRRLREGGWQSSIGIILAGRTLGLLGLGRIPDVHHSQWYGRQGESLVAVQHPVHAARGGGVGSADRAGRCQTYRCGHVTVSGGRRVRRIPLVWTDVLSGRLGLLP